MDWSQPPFIKKATNDGRSVSLIVTENLFWSESLTVDLFTDEPKGWIYWVESFYGRIERAHYDGSNRKIVLALSPNNILSAATIFKVNIEQLNHFPTVDVQNVLEEHDRLHFPPMQFRILTEN